MSESPDARVQRLAVLWRGDDEMLRTSLAEARRAGVGEREIKAIVDEAVREGDDKFAVPVIVGRLGYAARVHDRRPRPVPPIWTSDPNRG
jgi:hypothetical protein